MSCACVTGLPSPPPPVLPARSAASCTAKQRQSRSEMHRAVTLECTRSHLAFSGGSIRRYHSQRDVALNRRKCQLVRQRFAAFELECSLQSNHTMIECPFWHDTRAVLTTRATTTGAVCVKTNFKERLCKREAAQGKPYLQFSLLGFSGDGFGDGRLWPVPRPRLLLDSTVDFAFRHHALAHAQLNRCERRLQTHRRQE